MERSHLTVLLGLLALAAGSTAAVGAQSAVEASCEPSVLATQVSLFCAPDMPTAQCCEPVVASVDLGGGVPCLYLVAAEPQLIIAGLNATHLLTLYTACGGLRLGGARDLAAAACVGPAPPAAVFAAPPPPAAIRRKQPAREAPPPPATTEKLSPPPQQHGAAAAAAATAKAIPTHPAAAAPLGPVAAPPPPQPSSSGVSTPLHNGTTHVARISLSSVDVCEEGSFAVDLVNSCSGDDLVTPDCCKIVTAVVSIPGCYCRVAFEEVILTSSVSPTLILEINKDCGGTTIPDDCDETSSPPPPPSSACSDCTPRSPAPKALTITLLCVALLLLIVCCVLLVLKFKRNISECLDAWRISTWQRLRPWVVKAPSLPSPDIEMERMLNLKVPAHARETVAPVDKY